jgi:hypothetical protein
MHSMAIGETPNRCARPVAGESRVAADGKVLVRNSVSTLTANVIIGIELIGRGRGKQTARHARRRAFAKSPADAAVSLVGDRKPLAMVARPGGDVVKVDRTLILESFSPGEFRPEPARE